MKLSSPHLSICLWFNKEAHEAAEFYTQIFPDSGIDTITRYSSEGFEIHRQPAGSVMTVSFKLGSFTCIALNGGPYFTFNEAISLVVHCENQEEVNHYWDKLGEGGEFGNCGWLKDKFGVSWQIVPIQLHQMLSCSIPEKASAVTASMLKMKKLDISQLESAFHAK